MGVEYNDMIFIVIFPHFPSIIVYVFICEAVIHHHHHIIWKQFSIRLEGTPGAHEKGFYGIVGHPFVRYPLTLRSILSAVVSFIGKCAVLDISVGYTDLPWLLVLFFAFLSIVL